MTKDVAQVAVETPALPPWRNVLAVWLGGMIGAPLRVGFSYAIPGPPGSPDFPNWPWATAIENVLGAFLLGCLVVLLLEYWRPRKPWYPFLCSGILGSFTTFSTLTMELVTITQSGQIGLALMYGTASIAAGLVAAGLGVRLAKRIVTNLGEAAVQS